MSQTENFIESDSELDIDEIDRKINRKNTKIKTPYVEELKEYLVKINKDKNSETNVNVRNFRKPAPEEEEEKEENLSNNNEFRYSTISDEIDNSFGYLNDSSYSSDQDETYLKENFFKFVKGQKDNDFYKELNKVLEKYPDGPKNKIEPKVRSSLKNSTSNDQIEEEIFMENYRNTLQDKMKPDEIEKEVKRVRVFFDWLATNHSIYLFKRKENSIVVNVFHPSASENKFANNHKKVIYKPVDEDNNLKNLELRIYFDTKKYKNLLDIDQLDLFLTDPNDGEMLKSKKNETIQSSTVNDDNKEKIDEPSSENKNSMFDRLNRINPLRRIRGFSFTPINLFRQKK